MQAGDGDEDPPRFVVHDLAGGVDHGADHDCRIVEHALVGRGVAVIQQALARSGIRLDLLDILGRMEQFELLLGGRGGVKDPYLIIQVANVHLVPESMDAVLTEGVIVESVAAQLFAGVDSHRSTSCHYSQSSLWVGFGDFY